MSPTKTAEAIELPFRLRTRLGSRNHVLHGVQMPPWNGAILMGKRANHCKVYGHNAVICAKTAEPIDLPFGLWTQVGRMMHNFNRMHQVAPICPTTIFRDLCKMAEPIDLPFGLWTPVGRRKHKFNRICQVAPMCNYRTHCRHLANTIEPSVYGGDAPYVKLY